MDHNGRRQGPSSGKRSHSNYEADEERESETYNKRRSSSRDRRAPAMTNDLVEYRVLCAGAKIGSVIGKGGGIIKAIRQETRSRIKVEESIAGSDERVIYIASGKEPPPKDGGSERYHCSAQDALFQIHRRIAEGDYRSGSEDREDEPPQVVSRLLVPGHQIGCILGKGGRIIEQLRKDIPCQIRVMPKNQLPPCATEEDELVQISGSPNLVKKALYEISTRLYENPPRERYQGGFGAYSGGGGGYVQQGHGMGAVAPMYSGSYYSQGPMAGGMGGGGGGNGWSLSQGYPQGKMHHSENAPEEEFSIRVLCPNDKVGSMIGKGGSIIRKMREETGARIRVDDPLPDYDERVVHISSLEVMTSSQSQVVDAVFQVQKRLAELYMEKDESSIVITRLLVHSGQIGCLLGKGGSIITEMRKATRASIRIPPRDELPRIAGESDELIQISGELPNAQAALLQILNRLRVNLFKGQEGAVSEVYPMLLGGVGYAGSAPMMSGYDMGYDMSMAHSSYGNYSLSGGPTTTNTTSSQRSSSGRGSESRRRQRFHGQKSMRQKPMPLHVEA